VSNETTLTITRNPTSDPELRYTPAEQAVARSRWRRHRGSMTGRPTMEGRGRRSSWPATRGASWRRTSLSPSPRGPGWLWPGGCGGGRMTGRGEVDRLRARMRWGRVFLRSVTVNITKVARSKPADGGQGQATRGPACQRRVLRRTSFL